MRLHHSIVLIAALAVAGCANIATVKETKPQPPGSPGKVSDSAPPLSESISAAEVALRKLEANPNNEAALKEYNFAVGRIVGAIRAQKLAPWNGPVHAGAHTLSWKRDPNPEWNPRRFDLIPADQLKITGSYVSERETKAGLGAPVVAKRVADRAHEYAPTPHFFYAGTVVARFEGSRCIVSLEDPLRHESTRVGNRTFPLAADYTAPLAMMLVEMHPQKQGIPRLLHPAKFASTTRLARLEPYDPDKTVVLLVHGLMSSPATWLPLINHLRSDEEVRKHYQFWMYSYPTGYPYSYSAAILRTELDHMESKFPLRKKMVVIGHSMGGCISRLLVTDADRRIWDQMFDVPPERMNVSPEHRHILTESSIFTHRPEIGRVVFISAPLKGADLASSWLGRLGARLVQLPKDMLSLGTVLTKYAKNKEGHRHLDRFPDSVDTLSPDNDFVQALNKVPLVKGIPYHTIEGDRGRGDAPHSSDGLVPYWSSHLPNAVSEKIVPSGHNAQRNPEAWVEVERILKLNPH